MKASSLIKIGQLMLSNGVWEDKIIVDEYWVRMSFEASQDFAANVGLLWWRGRDFQKDYLYYDDELLEKYKVAGLPQRYIDELEKIKNKKQKNVKT